MKNQIGSLQLVMFILSFVLGINAFTSPNQEDDAAQEALMYDHTEGKIQAAEELAMVPQYQKARKDFDAMDTAYDSIAIDAYLKNEESPPTLTGLSQLLYAYQNRLESVSFYQLDDNQKRAFLSELGALKKDFYTGLKLASQQK